MFLSQSKFAEEILERTNMHNCSLCRTPVDTKSKLGLDGDHVNDPILYRSLVGALQYLTFTRPNLSYVLQHVCLYMYDPRDPHFTSLKRIMFVVLLIMVYSFMSRLLLAYTDADWITLFRSSAKAEYQGVANVVAETAWIHNLLLYMSANLVQHQRTKHIEIDIHFVRDFVASGQVRVLHIPSRFQYADIFMKGLPTVLFLEFRSSLNVQIYAVQHVVGDSGGWTTFGDYTTWASTKTFNVGDTLLFNYGSSHGVDVVSKSDYDNCVTSNALDSYSGGTTTVSLTQAGPMYFACPSFGHCSSGMKLAINVVSAGSNSPANTPTPSGTTPTPSDDGSNISPPTTTTPSTTPSSRPTTNGGSPNSRNMVVFLMGLDESYLAIKSNILTRETLPLVKAAFAIISGEESHRNVTSVGSLNLQQLFLQLRLLTIRGDLIITIGHTVDRCFELVCYPAGYIKRNLNSNTIPISSNNVSVDGHSNCVGSNNATTNISLVSLSNDQLSRLMNFLDDNGASSANANMAVLVNVVDISNLTVGHPNGTQALITKIRDLKINNDITLYDVLVVLEYTIVSNNCISSCYVPKTLWHQRLGHLADQVLDVLKSTLNLDSQSVSDHLCDTCNKAKQAREPFPLSDHKSTKISQLVHLDVCGPYKVVSRDGFRYFLTIVDDFSRVVWVYMLKGKDDVYDSIGDVLDETDLVGNFYENLVLNSEIEDLLVNTVRSLKKSIEPTCYKDVILDSNWIDAINAKIEALNRNHTWIITDLHANRKPIGCKWIFKIKYKANGELDINNAFLYGDLEEDVYMTIPQGSSDKNNQNKVCKLVKSLYELKQAPNGMKNLIEVIKTGDDINLSQRKYCLELLREYGLLGCKHVSTLMEPNSVLSYAPTEIDPLLDNIIGYQKLLGKLIYLTHTKPDIAYSVHCLTQYMHSPLKSHLNCALNVLIYLKNALGKGGGHIWWLEVVAASDGDVLWL
ncbi:ribonuclease H-like domain-containing protein [Tanacetum coccineum]